MKKQRDKEKARDGKNGISGFRGFLTLLLLTALVFSLAACGETGNEEEAKKLDINGLYQGTATYTEAKNDEAGKTQDMEFRMTDNEDGTATMTINDNSVAGTYDSQTGTFMMEHGFTWNLVFARDEEDITAKGTMTSGETGEGFTQEVALDLKKVGE